MRKLSIFTKLFLSIFLVALFCLITFSVLVYVNQKEALIRRTSDQLRSVNILKKRMVEKRLQDDEKFIWHFIKKVMLADTNQKFLPEKEFHRHKDFLEEFCEDYGHIDVMLLDENEQAVDSIFKGKFYSESEAEQGFSFVRVFVIEKSRYRLALVSSTTYLQKLMFENTGMGNTGESYIVGRDLKMITKSRFFPKQKPHSILVNTPSVHQALEGYTGTDIIPDYRGIPVLSAYAPVEHKGLDWVLLSEIDETEAMQAVLKLRNILLFVSLLIILVTFLAAFFLSRTIVHPIRQVSAGMLDLSKGIVPAPLPAPFYDNEEGHMKEALNRLIESFGKITGFASEIGKGNLKADFEPLGIRDELSRSLIDMRNQLREYQEKEKTLRRQKALSLLEGQENERRRIARDLHDGLGQWLTGINLKVAVIDMPEKQRQELKALITETINETRRITNNLMPNTLIDFGLESALRQMLSSLQKDSNIGISFDYKASGKSLPFEITINLYRIAQEAVNNIVKHARASELSLIVSQTEELLTMTVQDNGTGIGEDRRSGSGLGNMEERARLIKGKFKLDTSGKGTRISVTVPLLNSN